MINLKKLLLEQVERKYILPPTGDIFKVNDHVWWASRGVLKDKYGHLNGSQLSNFVEEIYDGLEKLGYLTLVWAGASDTLYVRGENGIARLSPTQRKKILKLADELAQEGIYYQVQLEDDGGHYEVLWSHSQS